MSDLLERLKAALADSYAIERELGQGGMATAYLAEDLKHHRTSRSRKPFLGFPRMLIWYGVLPNALMNKKMEQAER